MPQGQPAVIGKDAIRSLYSSFFEEFTVKVKGRVVKVEASGDLGYIWSSYTLTATSKGNLGRLRPDKCVCDSRTDSTKTRFQTGESETIENQKYD